MTGRSCRRPWRREILLAAATQKGRALLQDSAKTFLNDRAVEQAAVVQGNLTVSEGLPVRLEDKKAQQELSRTMTTSTRATIGVGKYYGGGAVR